MNKLLKFGIASLSVFVLNAYIQTNAKADEQVGATNSAILESPSANLNSNNSENAVPQVDSVSETQGNGSNETTNSSTSTTDKNNSSTELLENNNIISDGGQVNVEGQNATVSADGKSVTYSYTVAYQRISSSTHGQTVNDLLIRLPKIKDATVQFTLIGTRDAQGNPVNVNAPMTEISFVDTENYDRETFNTPTSEELEVGKTPYVVNTSNYEYGYMTDGKVKSYGLFTNFDKSQAYKVEVTVPMEEAKKIKYLAIDARMVWKSSQEGGIMSYETGSQNLEDYPNHRLAVDLDSGNLGGIGDPSSIDDSYVKNGHLIKSVANPSTYITPNNGDWTRIPEDTNINKETFFNYVETFNLKVNHNLEYYVSEKEDMADQDVSAFYTGNILVDYVIKGTDQKLKDTYTKLFLSPIYDSKGALVSYTVGEDKTDHSETITVDGTNYKLVGLSASSDAETGTLKDGTIHIVYEYEKEVQPAPVPSTDQTQEPTPESSSEQTRESTPESNSETRQSQNSNSEKATEAESKSVAEQAQLPNTGEANSQLFFTIASILMGFFGISLLKKTHDNK